MQTSLVLPAGLAGAEGAPEEEVYYERPRDLSGEDDSLVPDVVPTPFTTNTNCDLALTICVTSIAVASVVCTAPAYRTRQCTGAGTVGGQGTSPTKLPGRVDWFGDSYNWGQCSSYKATSGAATWPGGLGASGSGTQSTLSGCTKVNLWAWGFSGCVSVSADAYASSTARTQAVVTVTAISNSAYHSTSNQACVTAFGS